MAHLFHSGLPKWYRTLQRRPVVAAAVWIINYSLWGIDSNLRKLIQYISQSKWIDDKIVRCHEQKLVLSWRNFSAQMWTHYASLFPLRLLMNKWLQHIYCTAKHFCYTILLPRTSRLCQDPIKSDNTWYIDADLHNVALLPTSKCIYCMWKWGHWKGIKCFMDSVQPKWEQTKSSYMYVNMSILWLHFTVSNLQHLSSTLTQFPVLSTALSYQNKGKTKTHTHKK